MGMVTLSEEAAECFLVVIVVSRGDKGSDSAQTGHDSG